MTHTAHHAMLALHAALLNKNSAPAPSDRPLLPLLPGDPVRQLHGRFTPDHSANAYDYDASWREHIGGFVWNATVTLDGAVQSRPSGITRVLAHPSAREETIVREAVEASVTQLAGPSSAYASSALWGE